MDQGKWDAQTMHLLSFAVSARNVAITPGNILKLLFRVEGDTSAGGVPPPPPSPCTNSMTGSTSLVLGWAG